MVPESPRRPGAPAAGEENVAPRLVELFGDLASRLPAADDENAAGRKRLGVGVLLGEELHEVLGKLRRVGWQVWTLVAARRDDHGPRAHFSGRRAQDELIAVSFERRNRAALLHRRVERVGPTLEVIDEPGEVHEAVRVWAVVFRAGELDAPVR